MTDKETRFTPGPWRWKNFPGESTDQIDAEEGTVTICDVEGIDPAKFGVASVGGFECKRKYRPGEVEANGNLIAAAPDLYAALQGLISTVLDYERVNNLSPAPGRKYCWDATEQAIAALSKARGVLQSSGK